MLIGRDSQRPPPPASKREWWDEFNRYLRSNEWAKRRQAVRSRCKGICEGCGAVPMTQVHHLTYAHAGWEFLWELVGVCDRCHELLHRKAA